MKGGYTVGVYARCLAIKDGKYLLKDGNGLEMWIPYNKLFEAVVDNKIELTNLELDRTRFIYTKYNSAYTYNFLDCEENISRKAYEAQVKADVLGISSPVTETITINGEHIITNLGGTFEHDIVITDTSRVIKSSISSPKITFVGEKPLINRAGFGVLLNINCDIAIVKNKCVMSDFSTETKSDILIRANEIHVKHGYVDINTVYEMFVLFKDTNRKNNITDDICIIKVPFEKSHATNKQIMDAVKDVVRFVTDRAQLPGNVVDAIKRYCDLLLFLNSISLSVPKLKYKIEDLKKIVLGKLYELNNEIYSDTRYVSTFELQRIDKLVNQTCKLLSNYRR